MASVSFYDMVTFLGGKRRSSGLAVGLVGVTALAVLTACSPGLDNKIIPLQAPRLAGGSGSESIGSTGQVAGVEAAASGYPYFLHWDKTGRLLADTRITSYPYLLGVNSTPDGPTILAESHGPAQLGDAGDFVVQRVKVNGTIDTGFGINGVTLLPDIAAGENAPLVEAFAFRDGSALIQYTPQGTNTTLLYRLGTNGGLVWTQTIASASGIISPILSSSAVTYITDATGRSTLERRKLSDGTVDTTFHPAIPAGMTATNLTSNAVGTMVLAGSRAVASGSQMEMALYTAAGSLVRARAAAPPSGSKNRYCELVHAVMRKSGKILLVATCLGNVGYQVSADLVAAQWLSNGNADTLFGAKGVLYEPNGSGGRSATEQTDGSVLSFGGFGGKGGLIRFTR
jgi:hypothetical protein